MTTRKKVAAAALAKANGHDEQIHAKTKLPPRVLTADDLEFEVDGQTYLPHAGETVTIRRYLTSGAYEVLAGAFDAMKASTTNDGSKSDEVREQLREIRECLATMVLDWTWTDDTGEALPSPHGNPAAFAALGHIELAWVVSAVLGGSGVEAKNAG